MKRVMSRTAEVLGSKNDGVTEDRRPELEEDIEEETEGEDAGNFNPIAEMV